MRIVFFGTPVFAFKILSFLIKNKVNIIAVVTQPKSEESIGGVKQGMQQYPFISLFQPEKASASNFIHAMKELDPDLFVVAAYGQILSQELLNVPKLGSINVHASLLPKYRGAAPIQRCLMAGDKETGITIMKMTSKMDAGDILDFEKISISDEMTFGELEEKLIELASPLLLKTLKGNFQGTPQDESKVSFAPKIKIEDCDINWDKPATLIYNQIRALSPHPGARCNININGKNKVLKILKASIANISGKPRQILTINKNELIVACKEDALNILIVQLEGKKAMPINSFTIGCKTISVL